MRGGYLIAGGGTGGHVFPALALAGEIRRRRPEAPVVFVGTRQGLEAELVPKTGLPLAFVRARGLVGKSAAGRLAGLLTLPLGLVDSWRLLTVHGPRAVVGMGGYGSGPLVATAWARRIPTVIHESNAVPGLTNRILARVVTRVAVGTGAAVSRLKGAAVTGNPVRPEFFQTPSLSSRPAGRRPQLLVVGGSQGARILNDLVPEALAMVRRRGVGFDALHQAGRGRADEVSAAYARSGLAAEQVTVREFLDDIPDRYKAADLVLSRSGAMTSAEIAAAGRPALLVPFAAATHAHQEANARALEALGAAVVLEEKDATRERLADLLGDLLSDPARLARMGEAARRGARPDAAESLCDLVFSVEKKPA